MSLGLSYLKNSLGKSINGYLWSVFIKIRDPQSTDILDKLISLANNRERSLQILGKNMIFKIWFNNIKPLF